MRHVKQKKYLNMGTKHKTIAVDPDLVDKVKQFADKERRTIKGQLRIIFETYFKNQQPKLKI